MNDISERSTSNSRRQLWLTAVGAAAALVIGVLFATQVSAETDFYSCSTNTCISSNSWFIEDSGGDDDYYRTYGGSTVTPGPVTSVNAYVRSFSTPYHVTSPNQAIQCNTSSLSCGTAAIDIGSTSGASCGTGSGWHDVCYGVTRSWMKYNPFWGNEHFTSTNAQRGTLTCWNGSSSCYP
jgi:hypothetical protein